MNPVINILIRNAKGRGKQLSRCLESIVNQTYATKGEINIIGCYDFGDDYPVYEGFKYIEPNRSLGPFFYNDYCNFLKDQVTEGWFFFLDDDDYLANSNAIEEMAKQLDGDYDALVCQMSRDNGKIKPCAEMIMNREIASGKIGMPCLVVKSDLKDMADIPAVENGDFIWIKKIVAKAQTKFINQVLVHSPKRSFGK